MNSRVTVAAIQSSFSDHTPANIEKTTEFVKQAAGKGAQIILPSELFEGLYFCKEEKDEFFTLAKPYANHPTIAHFKRLAKDLNVVIPVSFFESDGNLYYNSLALIDADGTDLGLYRKSHIPDGPG